MTGRLEKWTRPGSFGPASVAPDVKHRIRLHVHTGRDCRRVPTVQERRRASRLGQKSAQACLREQKRRIYIPRGKPVGASVKKGHKIRNKDCYRLEMNV